MLLFGNLRIGVVTGSVNVHKSIVTYSLWHPTLEVLGFQRKAPLCCPGYIRFRALWFAEDQLVITYSYRLSPTASEAMQRRWENPSFSMSMAPEGIFTLKAASVSSLLLCRGPGSMQRTAIRKYLWSLYLFWDLPKTMQSSKSIILRKNVL